MRSIATLKDRNHDMRKPIAGVMLFVALDGSAAFTQEAGFVAKMHSQSSLRPDKVRSRSTREER
jgi:hypothetical protein